MHFRLILLAAAVLSACGDDNNSAVDADLPGVDARVIDAGIDAFNACPGQSTFQVGVEDWLSGEGIAGVIVSDGNTEASSAPNGRVLLCVAQSGALQISFTREGYVPHTHTTSGEFVAQLAATSGILSFPLLKPDDADALYAGVAKTRATDKATAMAMVRKQASGDAAAGATVSLSAAHEGAYTPGSTGMELNPGQVTGDDGLVLFLNAEPGAAVFTASGLRECEVPAMVPLAAGGTSSTAIVCSL